MSIPAGLKAVILSAITGGSEAVEWHISNRDQFKNVMLVYMFYADDHGVAATAFDREMLDKGAVHYVVTARKRIHVEPGHDDNHLILITRAYAEEVDPDPAVDRPAELGKFEQLITVPLF